MPIPSLSGQPLDVPPTPPLVSVVVATYNMAPYVAGAVQSVLDQTIKDLEVHVVDDGSTDDTKEALLSVLRDPRVHYHFQENAGQTRAKNLGIRNSRGRYVGFCDADDLWLPGKLELQLAAFEDGADVGVVYTRCQRIDSKGSLLPLKPQHEPSGWVTEELFMDNFVPFGTALVRKEALDVHGPFNESYRMGIDWELWLRLSNHYVFRCVPQVTYLYRVWSGQMSSNWKGRYEAAFRIMDEFLENYPGRVSPKRVRQAIAGSYANRGRARASISADYFGAIADAARAVANGYSPWKALRLVIRCSLRIAHLASGPLDPPEH